VPEHYLIDSNIFDKLIDEPETLELASQLVESGALELLSTHIQADEIARTPDAERLRRLLRVSVEQVPTYGFVLGSSRLGMARLSESESIESLRKGNLDHTEDALIAATAQFEGATLVTEDRRLAGRARARAIAVISWQEFRDRLNALSMTPDEAR
jgi:predicted nucleic acid-binding protein